MTKAEDGTITVLPDESAIIRCILGLGVIVAEADDGSGRAYIAVDPKPFGATNPEYKGLRTVMEEIAVTWLRQVAPHRLSDAYTSGY